MFFPLLILVAASIAVSLCSVFFATMSQNVIDIAVSHDKSKFVLAAFKLAGVIVIEIVLKVLISRMNVSFGGRLDMHFREHTFGTVLKKKWSSVHEYHSGDIVNRIRNDSSVITSGVMNIIPNGVMLITRVVGAFFVLFRIDSQFSLILLVTAPFILVFARLYSKKMKQFHKAVQQSEGKVTSYMLEAVQNIIVTKAFGNEDSSVSEAAQIQSETLRLRIKRNTWSIAANVSMVLLFTGSYAFAILWGAYKLSLGILSFGSFTAMVQLVNQVQTPFRSMSSLFVSYQNAIASAERILEIESLEDDPVLDKPIDVDEIYDGMSGIVFDNVTFTYGGEDILKSASCRIEKGEFVALSGISGSGKSTMIRLLLSLVEPTEGMVFLDGKEKIPMAAYLRPMFGYVPQGNMLISGSIAKNIAFYSDADDETIRRAAQTAKIDSVIDALPEGMNQTLGEKGSGLSEGQIQRVAIARALARSAPILLLDEATSALDEQTEIELLDALKKEKNKTVIIITHRKRVFDYCDKIITLQDGVLSETTNIQTKE
jgi:ATP-binding cassette subfamily B protein